MATASAFTGADLRCRVCLSSAAKRTLLPLATLMPGLKFGVTYLECLRSCTQLEVPITGAAGGVDCDLKYPMQICLRCSKALHVAHHIVRLACESDVALRAECAEVAQRQIKDELMEVEQASSPRSEIVDLAPFFKKITWEEAAGKLQKPEKPANAFSSQFDDFVKIYDVTKPIEITNIEEKISQSIIDNNTTRNIDSDILLEAKTEEAEVEIRVASQFVQNPAELLEIKTLRDENTVEANIEVLTSHFDPSFHQEEKEEQEFNKDDTLEDAIKILIQSNESTAEGGVNSSERGVLGTIENQSFTQIAKTATDNGEPLSDAALKFIEEIKENLTNGVRDYALQRNKTKVLVETEELQKAFESKEAEIDDNNELLCVLCDKRFNDMQIFVRHRNRHKGITPFRCNTCNFFTCYSESLRKHYKREHNFEATNDMLNIPINPNNTPMEKPYVEKIYQCTVCDFETQKYVTMWDHIDIRHPMVVDIDSPADSFITTVFNCPDCYRTFKDQKSMRTHFTFMHGSSVGIKKQSTEAYICEHCDKQFWHKVSLVSHQRVCRLREAVCCHICNKKCVSVRVFEQHLRAEHNVVTIHECEVCSKPFKNRESLFIHRKRHSERHFQCADCPKTYINNSELNVHIARMHSSGANVICRLCGLTFPHLRLLREHEEKEHNRKLLKCEKCDFTSPWRCGLRLHAYKHSGKPYICAICGRHYSLRSYLRRHSIRAHSIAPTDDEMAEMFRKKFGYSSRYDVFSTANNSLEITEVDEVDIEQELKEYGLKFEDIVKGLFENGLEEDLFNLSG